MSRSGQRAKDANENDDDGGGSDDLSTLPRGSRWTSRLSKTVDWQKMATKPAFRAFQQKPPVGRTPGTEDCVMRRVFDLLSTQDIRVVTEFFGLQDAPPDDR